MQCSLLSLILILSLPLLNSSRPLGLEPDAPNPNSGPHSSSLAQIESYLTRFGYLPEPDRTEPTDSFHKRLESAVALYQANHGLPVTRRLDSQTLTQLNTPRCGVPDQTQTQETKPTPNKTGPVQRFAFYPGQPSWTARSKPLKLTYAVSTENTITYLNRSEVTAAIHRAFARWAAVIPVEFVESADYEEADVKVGFYEGAHGDGEPFDGVLGILGHAFSPESGRLHLDAAERWAVGFGAEAEAEDVAVDLESVATHEIGHVLGLGHSAVRDAVMFPSLSPRTVKRELRADDVEGVQELYGRNPRFSVSQLVATSSSAAERSGSRNFVSGGLRGTWVAGVLGVVVGMAVGG